MYAVSGILKGFDQLMNLVMDDVVEEYEGELPARWASFQDSMWSYVS